MHKKNKISSTGVLISP